MLTASALISSFTSAAMLPPRPAPHSFAPNAPASMAPSTRTSSSGDETPIFSSFTKKKKRRKEKRRTISHILCVLSVRYQFPVQVRRTSVPLAPPDCVFFSVFLFLPLSLSLCVFFSLSPSSLIMLRAEGSLTNR